ncbi:MAG TPA: type II secretion system protein [Acidobacteriaceae bacterium]
MSFQARRMRSSNEDFTLPTAPSARRPHRPTEAGFTLVELLIVMSVILILMTLAIPQMQKVIKRGNETSAIQSLRDLDSQEGTYNSTYPTHGYACSLAALGGKPNSGPPTPEAAQLIPEDLASGNKSGYTFAITNCTKVTVNNQDEITSYEVTAVPNTVGKTGDRGFCTDGNEIRYDPKGSTNCTELLQ